MENEIQISNNQNQSNSIVLSPEETRIAGVLYPLNHLRSFPLSKTELEELSILVMKYNPELPIETLQELMDKFFTQEFKYDNKDGAYQNIAKGLKYLDGSWFTDQL